MIFAANWKMNITPAEARDFTALFVERVPAQNGRTLAFFPSAVALETTAAALSNRADVTVGAQDVYWEAKGAFTGATSTALARSAGARCALVGHSERRHVFGESDDDTRRKVRAVLDAGLAPYLCVGEKLEEREAGQTAAVVLRQLTTATNGLSGDELGMLVIAYEPVWAIGTGRNATPEDAAEVHVAIRDALGMVTVPILYGGSVSKTNVEALLSRPEIDGVLVGGASLDAAVWAEVVTLGTRAKVDAGGRG